jgi:hypothetical protein
MRRFREIIIEAEDIKAVCPDCKYPLELAKLPLEGIGDNAVLPMLYCAECDAYFIAWNMTNE